MSRKIPERTYQAIRKAARDRCGYCLAPQELVYGPLEIDHLIPASLGGSDEEANLWLACSWCNTFKSAVVSAVDSLTGEEHPLFNPRQQRWADHFSWPENGAEIVGITGTGRVTVAVLRMNDPGPLGTRRAWHSIGWYPPIDEEKR